VLELFPDTAVVDGGELNVGGVGATALAREFGTPLVVYCRTTLLARAHAYRRALADGTVLYGTKAFPNVALLRLFAAEGLGADVSSLGELGFALRAGVPGERIVFHGNNKSGDEIHAAVAAGACVAVDSLDDVVRVAPTRARVLVRVTPDVEAHTHRSIQTAHSESKFGLAPDDALAAIASLQSGGVDVVGLHLHIGSQLARADESLVAVDRLVEVARRARAQLGWTPAVVDLGGGLGVRHNRDEHVPDPEAFAGAIAARFKNAWDESVHVLLEPGRSLVGQAGFTLYEVGVVKRARDVTYVGVDGGMSDNPRPQLYRARFDALLANRADAAPEGTFRVAGKHCESGDVLIDAVELPEPRRGDLLTVPATGAYTLAMASNYNGVARPAAVLVGDGQAELIRRRETIDDLLAVEVA
jgi:diaminopimelate decarboxylase